MLLALIEMTLVLNLHGFFSPADLHIACFPRIDCKKCKLCGDFYEGLYRGESSRDCILYYREQCNCKTDRKGIWNQQIYGTYGCNKMERFVWVIE